MEAIMANKVVDWILDKRWQHWRFEWWWLIGVAVMIAVALPWWWNEKSGVAVVQPIQQIELPQGLAVSPAPIRDAEQVFASMKQRIRILSAQVEKQRVQLELAQHELAQFKSSQPIDLKSEREVGHYAKDVLGDLGLKSLTVVNR
jgi:hypothetical protein